MAEQIISPGVFTNEDVPTILEAAAAPIGAAIVGPTPLGPVNIPTLCTTFTDFTSKFGTTFESGSDDHSFLTSISAYNYFQQGGTNLLVTRVVSGSRGNFDAATSSFVAPSGAFTEAGAASGVSSNLFSLKTFGEGDILNTTASLGYYGQSESGSISSGSKDNLRWEITNVDLAKGTFALSIRQGNDSGDNKKVLETFRSLTLDPNSDNYIEKIIGNYNSQVAIDPDDSSIYIQKLGEFPNQSKYVYVSEVFETTPDYLDSFGNRTSDAYTASMPSAQIGAFQGGRGAVFTPGHTPPNMNDKISDGNYQGLKNSDYTDVMNLLIDKDEYKFNLISTPGLIYDSTTDSAVNTLINTVTSRGDAIYPMDSAFYTDDVDAVIAAAEGLDSNFAATYWPWVLINDPQTNKSIWAPASTVIPSVYVFNDTVTAAWFAPAGLTRGSMRNVILPSRSLPRGERDKLYEGKINPIVKFPSTGVAVYGQKTLQSVASATDRVNVRRLLIALKNFIGTVAEGLVFEPNSLATRNAFLAVVTPYLELVQQRQGLYAFKVTMDDTNNGPDVIDRNELRGSIYIQPVKAAEFIVLDFNVLPTGAEFPG